jgi:hypothetical protein
MVAGAVVVLLISLATLDVAIVLGVTALFEALPGLAVAIIILIVFVEHPGRGTSPRGGGGEDRRGGPVGAGGLLVAVARRRGVRAALPTSASGPPGSPHSSCSPPLLVAG